MRACPYPAGGSRADAAADAGNVHVTTDTLVIGRQLGSEGKDKIVYQGRRGAQEPWVAVAQFKTQSSCVQPKLRRSGTKSRAAIRKEAGFQRRAAAAGLAPHILEEDLDRSRLVMEMLPGGTLKDVAQRQGGRLTIEQQRRLLHLLRQLGAPIASGGAATLHNDLSNPCNYLSDGDGTFFVIDFGMAKEIDSTTRAPLNLPPSLAAGANLLAIQHLLYDVQQGLMTHGILIEVPTELVRGWRDFERCVAETRSGVSTAASLPTTAWHQVEVPPALRPRRRASIPMHKSAAMELLESSVEDDDERGSSPLGALPPASPPPLLPPRRGLCHVQCNATLLFVWVLCLGASAVAIIHSPRGLASAVPPPLLGARALGQWWAHGDKSVPTTVDEERDEL